MNEKAWIGIDLDRTLAQYESGDYAKFGEFHIGEPIKGTQRSVKAMISDGKRVKIFTARVAESTDLPRLHKAIGDWTELHLGYRLEATCIKDRHCLFIVDDRAIGIHPNEGTACEECLERLGYFDNY